MDFIAQEQAKIVVQPLMKLHIPFTEMWKHIYKDADALCRANLFERIPPLQEVSTLLKDASAVSNPTDEMNTRLNSLQIGQEAIRRISNLGDLYVRQQRERITRKCACWKKKEDEVLAAILP